MEARIAIIAMTTSNSISVKAWCALVATRVFLWETRWDGMYGEWFMVVTLSKVYTVDETAMAKSRAALW